MACKSRKTELICEVCQKPFLVPPSGVGRRRRCSKACQATTFRKPEPIEPYIAAELGPCVEWQGAVAGGAYATKGRSGSYGAKVVDGRHCYVHRLEWEKHNGPIPDGFHVLHKCDNTLCYRIDHLFLGTQKDNVQDMVKKGRTPGGKAKLTPDEARIVRDSDEPADVLMKRFGISRMLVSLIKRRLIWRKLDII